MTKVEKAILLKQELDELRPLSKADEMRIMQKFRLDWNYHSNHLEGNTLTYGETKALILFGITAQGKTLQEHFEITGHDEAIKWVLEVLKEDRPLTENFIRELHRLILKEPYEKEAITADGQPTTKRINIGVYKFTPNHVKTRTGEIFYFATPEETPAKMHDLLQWYRAESARENIEPILLAAQFHYRFIRIHPFDDGNGRAARILMNFILMKFGYPPVIIKTEDKENYFAALRQADAGIIEPFIEYIAENLVCSLEIMISGAKGESVEEEDDLEKEILLLEQQFKSIEQPIIVSRNKHSIVKLFQKSIIPLYNKFVEKNKLFDSFYSDIENSLMIGDISLNKKYNNTEIVERLLDITVDKITDANISCKFSGLKQLTLLDEEYTASIDIQFEKSFYFIKSSRAKIRKTYEEGLNEEEISAMVKIQIKNHKLWLANIVEYIKRDDS